MRLIKISGGLGDVIASLPLIEQIPEDCELQFDPLLENTGVARLFMCLPNVKKAFYESYPFQSEDIGPLHFDFTKSLPQNLARVLQERTGIVVEPRLTAQTLKFHCGNVSEYQIVVHPYTAAVARRWSHWNNVTFPLPVIVSGSKNDPRDFLPNYPFSSMDVYDTAAMMKRARLCVCINSSHLHIANVIGVRHITIYTDPSHSWQFPSSGVSLVNPCALHLSNYIKDEVQRAAGSSLFMEVSPGEAIDKKIILEIKLERCAVHQQAHIVSELEQTTLLVDKYISKTAELDLLVNQLRLVNKQIWNDMDEMAVLSSANDLNARFAKVAADVFRNNIERANIKKDINKMLLSKFHEEKKYG